MRLLVTGSERSGTHYMWAMLQRLGLDVHHEGVGKDGAVSWLYGHRTRHDHHPRDLKAEAADLHRLMYLVGGV